MIRQLRTRYARRALAGRLMWAALGVLCVALVLPARAEEAPVPRPRPAAAETVTPPQAEIAPDAVPLVPLPRARPGPAQAGAAADPAEAETPADAESAVEGEGETKVATEPAEPKIYQTACPAVLNGQVEAQSLPPISEGQCGLLSPLGVSGVLVNGRMVPISGAPVLGCGMASALPQWVSAVDSYVQARDNTSVESLIAGTSYMCRNVNNAKAGDLSDHAFADALDVVGFKLADGRSITIEAGWTGTEAEGSRIVRHAHDAACGLFTTVLGPEANALHHDHLHLDLKCHGKTCTARLCE